MEARATERQQERLGTPVRVLLAATFLMNVGSFAVVPFLAVYLTHTLHLSAWQVGSVLTVQLLCARLLPLATGMVGDRLSHSRNLVTGVLLRGLGFVGLAQSGWFGWVFAASALVGIGSAWYDPSVSAVFAGQPERQRKRTFTLYNQALNAGAVLGPLAGAALIAVDPTLPFYWGGVVFFVMAALLWYYRRHYRTVRTEKRVRDSMSRLWADRRFVRFTCIMVLFWAVYTQLSVSFPLEMMRISGEERWVSALFVVNGTSGVALMFLLRRFIERRPPLQVVRTGLWWLGLSFCLVPLVPGAPLVWLLFCMLLFTLGETMVLPGSDLAIAECTEGEDAGAYFGMYKLSWAAGGTVGNYAGAWLMNQGGEVWPWMVYGAAGFCACVLIGRLERNPAR